MVTIKIVDAVNAECSDIHQVKDCLEYDSSRWKDGPYHKIKESQRAFLCSHDKRRSKGMFLAGLVSRVIGYCRRKGIELQVDSYMTDKVVFKKPSLPGIDFRPDQYDLIDKVRTFKRGIVKSPTGSGKTVLAGAIVSMLPGSIVCFIVHTQSLFRQTVDEFSRWFGVEEIGSAGDNEFNMRRINIIMVQTAVSLIKRDRPESAAFIDMLGDCDAIIVDEAHHAGNEDGNYSAIFKESCAPIRIGVTATTLDEKKSKKKALVCEGYLGPIIGEFTLEEGIKQGILAKPRVKLIPVPMNPKLNAIRTFKEIYPAAIINNRTRNRLIAKEIREQNDASLSVLVMVIDVKNGHAEQIATIAKDIYGIDCEIVKGETKKENDAAKRRLEAKEAMCVIATAVWREGINIKSLGCVINACGYKSEIMTLQAIGRGLRTMAGKTDLLIIDFLDPYDYVAQHTIQRLNVYVENGWL